MQIFEDEIATSARVTKKSPPEWEGFHERYYIGKNYLPM